MGRQVKRLVLLLCVTNLILSSFGQPSITNPTATSTLEPANTKTSTSTLIPTVPVIDMPSPTIIPTRILASVKENETPDLTMDFSVFGQFPYDELGCDAIGERLDF